MASLESDAATNLVSATADAAGWGTGGIGSLANSLVDALVRRLRGRCRRTESERVTAA